VSTACRFHDAVSAVELDSRYAKVRRCVESSDARRDRLGGRLFAQPISAVAAGLVGEATASGDIGAKAGVSPCASSWFRRARARARRTAPLRPRSASGRTTLPDWRGDTIPALLNRGPTSSPGFLALMRSAMDREDNVPPTTAPSRTLFARAVLQPSPSSCQLATPPSGAYRNATAPPAQAAHRRAARAHTTAHAGESDTMTAAGLLCAVNTSRFAAARTRP